MAFLSTAGNNANYTDDFGNDSSLSWSLWQIRWGNSDDFSFNNGALTLRSTAAEGWSNTGFMQSDFGASSGSGYGTYTAVASLDSNQGGGVCIDLWPSNNQWPGAEIDLLETAGSDRNTAYATIHWQGSNNSNQSDWHAISVDLTQKNNFSIDWEKGSLTYYINGQEVFQNTSHVPLDAADGGVNESFGAEVTGAKYSAVSSETDLNLYSMSYAASGSSANATRALTGAVTTKAATAAAAPMQFISNSHATIGIASGQTLTEQGTGNTLVLPKSGSVSLSGNTSSDTFDMRSALATAGWNGQMSDLAKYISAAPTQSGADLLVSVHKASGASVLALSLVGQGHEALATVEAHSLFG